MKITELQLLVNRIMEVQQLVGQHLGSEEASRSENIRKAKESDRIRDKRVNRSESAQKKEMKKPQEKEAEERGAHKIDIRI